MKLEPDIRGKTILGEVMALFGSRSSFKKSTFFSKATRVAVLEEKQRRIDKSSFGATVFSS